MRKREQYCVKSFFVTMEKHSMRLWAAGEDEVREMRHECCLRYQRWVLRHFSVADDDDHLKNPGFYFLEGSTAKIAVPALFRSPFLTDGFFRHLWRFPDSFMSWEKRPQYFFALMVLAIFSWTWMFMSFLTKTHSYLHTLTGSRPGLKQLRGMWSERWPPGSGH